MIKHVVHVPGYIKYMDENDRIVAIRNGDRLTFTVGATRKEKKEVKELDKLVNFEEGDDEVS